MTTKNKGWISPSKLNIKKEEIVWHAHEYDYIPGTNEIFLFGYEQYVHPDQDGEPGVEWGMANRFIRNLMMAMRNSQDPILVHMKSCGGDWAEGMAIHNAIKACPNPVTILSYTHARSMSSLILQAANKRVMMPDSTFMFHDGTMAMDGTVKQYFTEGEQLLLSRERMMNIYIDAMKERGKMKSWSRKRIYAWLRDLMDKKEEVYLNADQAVKHGFADEVFGANGSYNWPSLLEYDDKQLER